MSKRTEVTAVVLAIVLALIATAQAMWATPILNDILAASNAALPLPSRVAVMVSREWLPVFIILVLGTLAAVRQASRSGDAAARVFVLQLACLAFAVLIALQVGIALSFATLARAVG